MTDTDHALTDPALTTSKNTQTGTTTDMTPTNKRNNNRVPHTSLTSKTLIKREFLPLFP